MLSSYRQVLSRPGALAFSATGLVARLPISMAGLGIVLLVQAQSGSYGVAGAVSAAYMVSNAVLAILQGRLLDRVGQGRVLAVASVVFAVAMSLLVVSVSADWPRTATFVTAALAGGSLPQIGSCVRARWSHVLDAPPQVQTAYALESVLDEAVFITGPILVTVLATAVDPIAGVAAATVAGTVGGLAFAAQRGTEPPVRRAGTDGPRPPMPWRTVLPLAVVFAALGVLFGAAEVTTVAFADEQGHRSWSGGLLALWALGSMVSGLVTGAIAWRRGPASRLRIGAVGMALAMAPLFLVGSLPLMGLLLLVGGVAIAPTMVAGLSLIERSVPAARLTEGMAIAQTGLVAGVAPGATISGVVIDAHGASAAYLVSLTAGVVAALAAQVVPRSAASGAPEGTDPTSGRADEPSEAPVAS